MTTDRQNMHQVHRKDCMDAIDLLYRSRFKEAVESTTTTRRTRRRRKSFLPTCKGIVSGQRTIEEAEVGNRTIPTEVVETDTETETGTGTGTKAEKIGGEVSLRAELEMPTSVLEPVTQRDLRLWILLLLLPYSILA